jgi:hypothetical protein
MHPIDFIAPHIEKTELPEKPREGICAFTGRLTETVNRKKLVKSSFTNENLMQAPTSDRVGVNAWHCLKNRKTKSSWYCDRDGFRKLTRQELRDIVIDGNYPDIWSGYATTTYKKHGSLVSHVNTDSVIWRFEMLDVDCSNRKKMLTIWKRLNKEIRAGLGRSILETLDCPISIMKKYGWKKWIDFKTWAKTICNTPLYQFMCYLLPSQKELKAEEKAKKREMELF